MCTDFELEGFKSMKMRKMAFSSNFHAFSLLTQNPCTFWQIHHKLGHLARAKSIRNLQKYFIYPKWDTCYANSSNFGTSCTVLATVPNRIRNFNFFFSECIRWTHTQLWVPQTWSSVNPLDHKKAYKTVPLQILVSVHLTRQ